MYFWLLKIKGNCYFTDAEEREKAEVEQKLTEKQSLQERPFKANEDLSKQKNQKTISSIGGSPQVEEAPPERKDEEMVKAES